MYSTVDEVKKMVDEGAMVYLTDDNRTGEIDETKITDAISDADSEINGYIQKRYPLPLPSVPPVINKLSKDIALYNLFSRRGIDKEKNDDTVLQRYKNAVKFLENLSKGIVDLGVTATEVKPVVEINLNSNKKLFSRNSLRGM